MRAWLIVFLLLTSGCERCSGCGCAPSALEVGGDHPYYRCLAAEPPAARTWELSGMALRLEGRDLHLERAPSPLRIAAFAGPAPYGPPSDAALAAVRAGRPHLVVVLGGLGDEVEEATATLGALASLSLPTLVLGGGEDDAEVLDEAFDELDADAAPSLIDARSLRRVAVGRETLVLLSGAPRGRYARTETACGFAPEDAAALADGLGESAGERRWLVAWAAPSGGGEHAVGRGFGGVDAGDPDVARLAEALGGVGGIFAWPRSSALEPTHAAGDRRAAVGEALPDLRIVVAPLGGTPAEGADGRQVAPQPTFLELSPAGLAWVEGPAGRADAAPSGAP